MHFFGKDAIDQTAVFHQVLLRSPIRFRSRRAGGAGKSEDRRTRIEQPHFLHVFGRGNGRRHWRVRGMAGKRKQCQKAGKSEQIFLHDRLHDRDHAESIAGASVRAMGKQGKTPSGRTKCNNNVSFQKVSSVSVRKTSCPPPPPRGQAPAGIPFGSVIKKWDSRLRGSDCLYWIFHLVFVH